MSSAVRGLLSTPLRVQLINESRLAFATRVESLIGKRLPPTPTPPPSIHPPPFILAHVPSVLFVYPFLCILLLLPLILPPIKYLLTRKWAFRGRIEINHGWPGDEFKKNFVEKKKKVLLRVNCLRVSLYTFAYIKAR